MTWKEQQISSGRTQSIWLVYHYSQRDMRLLLKHFKYCITKQGLDSLAPEREQRVDVQLTLK